MKIYDLLIEAYDTSKARIEHAEDLVLTNGVSGATLAVSALQQAATNPETLSIKPDGRPAIKWGRDSGGFVMGDKYMNPLPHSIEQLTGILNSRKGGGREGLVQMYQSLWKVFEASVPSVNGYLFGDLMYAQRPAVQGGNFVMKPNTVEYSVPVQSALGQGIANSVAGIVVHTFLPANSQTGEHIQDISKVPGIKPVGALLMIADSMPAVGQIRTPNLQGLNGLISKYGPQVNQFINPQVLAAKRIVGMSALMKKFVNQQVTMKSFDNMSDGFISWLSTNSSGSMQNNINALIQENPIGYKAMWHIFTAIANAKNQIVTQLDQSPGDMTATINGEPGQEGYLVHTKYGPVKLINRFKFSAANFAKDA